MKPPVCRACGSEHWTTQPCPSGLEPRVSGLQSQYGVTKSPSVTERRVTKASVTKGQSANSVTPALEAARERIAELEAEVKALKRALAESSLKLEGFASRRTEGELAASGASARPSLASAPWRPEGSKPRGRPAEGERALSGAERARRKREKAKLAKRAQAEAGKAKSGALDFKG